MSGCDYPCTCDDWMELKLAREADNRCGTCGEPNPCTFCPEHFGPRDTRNGQDRWPA